MVGGKLIEAALLDKGGAGCEIWRLWCYSEEGEVAVKVRVEPKQELPKLGQEVWWHSGKVYFDNDTKSLLKVGNSYDPRGSYIRKGR